MKKFIFAAAAAVMLLAGCKEKDWCSMVREKEDAFMEYFFSIDDSVGQEEAEQMIDARYRVLQKEVEAIAAKGLKKHNDDSVAVFLVKEMYDLEILDNDGLCKAIRALGPNAQADPSIVALKSNIEKVLATGEGTHFLDFSAEQPDGKIKRLSDYAGKGKYCLVDFWASWCGPCKGEIPNLMEVYDRYAKKGLEMVSVAVWDDPQASIDTAAAYGIRWNQIVNAQKTPTEIYGIQGIPHIMLIGPDGTILKRDLRGKRISEEIGKYLI